MDVCVVCLENNGGTPSHIYISSKKWKECNMQHIVEKHLWWWFLRQPINKDHKQWICLECWQELTSFHEFAQRVKNAHKLYRVTMKKQNVQVVNESGEENQVTELGAGSSSSAPREGMVITPIVNDEDDDRPLINIRKRKHTQIDEVNIKKEAGCDISHAESMDQNDEEILPNAEYSVAHLNEPPPRRRGSIRNETLHDTKSLEDIKSILHQQNVLNKQIINGINELKNTVGKQNSQITNVLSNQIASLKTSVTSHFEAPKFTTLFPISSEDELYAFESMITEENQSEVVSAVKRVIGPKGIEKGICHLFSNELIFEYNVNGIYGKKRLLDYEKTVNVLFLASSDSETSLVEFNIQLRKAIKTAKNRYFKVKCSNRKKINDSNDTTFEIYEEDNSQSVQNEPGCSSYN